MTGKRPRGPTIVDLKRPVIDRANAERFRIGALEVDFLCVLDVEEDRSVRAGGLREQQPPPGVDERLGCDRITVREAGVVRAEVEVQTVASSFGSHSVAQPGIGSKFTS